MIRVVIGRENSPYKDRAEYLEWLKNDIKFVHNYTQSVIYFYLK